jgi:hypothetical protein
MKYSSVIVALLIGLAGPLPALAQDDFGSEGSDGGDVESLEGLESATPTDNVNELNANGSPNAAGVGGNKAGGADDFDIGNAQGDASDEGGGDEFFDDKPVDIGGQAGAGEAAGSPSAFGNGSDQGAKAAEGNNPTKTPTPIDTVNPVVTDSAPPVNPAAAPANPVANPAAPGDAQTLMNQISAEGALAPGSSANATATTEATGNEETATAVAPELPAAPPLPPPNEFAGAPPVPGTMRLMAEGEAPEEYMVQPGDTLFDICDQLLDEPGYWPKLWALNPEIKNPHFIFPNMRLRFYPGDDDTPPYLQVVTEDDVIPIDKGDLDEEQLVAEKVVFEVEAETIEEGALIEVIGPDGVDGEVEEFLVGGKLYSGDDIQVQVPGFIFREEKEPLAYVIGGSRGEISAGPGRKVLLEAMDGVQNGTLYTVLRRGEEIEDFETGDTVGYKYYFIANARVQKGLDDDIYIAAVENVRMSVMPEDIIVNYISTNRSIPSNTAVGALSAVNARVVGFQFAMQEMGGMGNYAFIDKGNGDGVSPGMYLPVFATPGYLTSSFGDGDLPEDYELVGIIRIIDTTEAGSVGYVMQNTQELRVGDKTSKG